MTEKLQAKLSAAVFSLASFVVYLTTLPPEQQDRLTGPLVALIPLQWRPEVSLICKAAATLSGFWGIFQATHSGPAPIVVSVPPSTPITQPPAKP